MAASDGDLSNLKDILQTYNRLTELCFSKCVSNMNYRELTTPECVCADRCSNKFISGNQRIMGVFMDVQTRKQQLMYEEALKQQEASVNQSQTALTNENSTSLQDTTLTAESDIKSTENNTIKAKTP